MWAVTASLCVCSEGLTPYLLLCIGKSTLGQVAKDFRYKLIQGLVAASVLFSS